MDQATKNQFNDIFIRQYERLTGSKTAAGGVTLTMNHLALLILFGERELEMSDITSEVADRYTMDELLQDVKEIGIPVDEDFQAAFQEFEQKKYIEQRPDGHIHGYSDCKEAARTLNRIFPKMQGLSLLAYIWQTIAEVDSGRTDLTAALSRFDQTLDNQGVIPPKPKIPVINPLPIPTPAPPEEKKEPEALRKGSRIIRDYVVTEAHSKTKSAMQEPVDLNATDNRKEALPTLDLNEAANDHKIQEQTAAMLQKIAELERSLAAAEEEKEVVTPETALTLQPEAPTEAAAANNTQTAVPVDDEDEIARKIAAFEKELALVCPICKTGILQEKATAAGKVFYACEAKSCNFISWGKPHNIPCSRCKNPFLVEVKDAAGETSLRCPRATCQHRQPLNPEGVKVVRKRLVRRKV